MLYNCYVLIYSNKVLYPPFMCFSGETLGVPIHVFGPETHMTAIVGMALSKKKIPPPVARKLTTANFALPGGQVNTAFLTSI